MFVCAICTGEFRWCSLPPISGESDRTNKYRNYRSETNMKWNWWNVWHVLFILLRCISHHRNVYRTYFCALQCSWASAISVHFDHFVFARFDVVAMMSFVRYVKFLLLFFFCSADVVWVIERATTSTQKYFIIAIFRLRFFHIFYVFGRRSLREFSIDLVVASLGCAQRQTEHFHCFRTKWEEIFFSSSSSAFSLDFLLIFIGRSEEKPFTQSIYRQRIKDIFLLFHQRWQWDPKKKSAEQTKGKKNLCVFFRRAFFSDVVNWMAVSFMCNLIAIVFCIKYPFLLFVITEFLIRDCRR